VERFAEAHPGIEVIRPPAQMARIDIVGNQRAEAQANLAWRGRPREVP
jgi:hypothetical protein